jgi:hypothetical protein
MRVSSSSSEAFAVWGLLWRLIFSIARTAIRRFNSPSTRSIKSILVKTSGGHCFHRLSFSWLLNHGHEAIQKGKGYVTTYFSLHNPVTAGFSGANLPAVTE